MSIKASVCSVETAWLARKLPAKDAYNLCCDHKRTVMLGTVTAELSIQEADFKDIEIGEVESLM